jgi:hypothetical protein
MAALPAVRQDDRAHRAQPIVEWLLEQERRLETRRRYRVCKGRLCRYRADLRGLLEALASYGKTVTGCGGCTKGNAVTFCGIGLDLVSCIAEVNEEKFGASTGYCPGTFVTGSCGAKLSFWLAAPA